MSDGTTKERGSRRVMKAMVVGKSGNKTISVIVERRGPHPAYGKVVRTKKKYQVHDEENAAKIGDAVEVIESRPLSRQKRWRLVNIIGR